MIIVGIEIMQTLTLKQSDVESIRNRGNKKIDSDGSIMIKLDVFYRFNDATIMISQICGKPYNEIEIHGKLKNAHSIDSHYSSCEIECDDELFEILISE